MEIYYIKLFRSYIGFENSNGYNMTLGGDGTRKLTLDDLNIIAEKYKECNSTREVAKELEQYKDGSGSYIARILNSLDIPIHEIWLKNHQRKIAKLDKETEEIICIYDSIRKANIDLGKPVDSSNIRSCLDGKTKTAYGFKWIDYVEELFRRLQQIYFHRLVKI